MRLLLTTVCLLVVLNCALAKPSDGMRLKELRELLELYQRMGPPGEAGAKGPPPGENGPTGGEGPSSEEGENGPTGGQGPESFLPAFTDEQKEEMENFCRDLTDDDPVPIHNLCELAAAVKNFFEGEPGSEGPGSTESEGSGLPPFPEGSGFPPPPPTEEGVLRKLLRALLKN
mgnify:CR=1 FL=1